MLETRGRGTRFASVSQTKAVFRLQYARIIIVFDRWSFLTSLSLNILNTSTISGTDP